MKTWETETRENEKNTLFKVMLDCSRELVGFLPYANDGAGCTLSMMQFKMNGVAEKLIDATKHCLNLGIQQVIPGNYFGNIGFAINRFAKSFSNFDFVRRRSR